MITRKSRSQHSWAVSLTPDSENARIPAWCDRILKKGHNLKQINYTTAPLYFSDHRPVYATFQCTISHVDESVKERLNRDIYESRRSQLEKLAAKAKGAIRDNDDDNGDDDDDIMDYESIASELPAASSDRKKWWLDDGKRSIPTILLAVFFK